MEVQVEINCKLGNMKKIVSWSVYPPNAGKTEPHKVVIQSHARIAEVDTNTGKAMLSKACPNGAYFLHLSKILGATEVDVPPEVVKALLGAQPKSGAEIGPGVYVA